MITFRKISKIHDEMHYKPEKSINYFYQICLYRDPKIKKYAIRRFVYNEYDEILKVDIRHFGSKALAKLVKKLAPHQYKMFPTIDHKNISHPNRSELETGRSELFQNNFGEFKPFNLS